MKKPILRNFLAILAAFLIAAVFVLGIEAHGHRLYPLPEGFNSADLEQVAQYVKTAPTGALLFVLLAQSAGSFVGGAVTGFLASSRKTLIALLYGVLALLMAALNVLLIPHPGWMVGLALLLPIPLALVGSKIAQSTLPRSQTIG